jgi:hypothetical protein
MYISLYSCYMFRPISWPSSDICLYYTTVHIFTTIIYVYMLYCLYTLYVILSIHYTWALFLPCTVAGGLCMCAYVVLASYWGLCTAGFSVWTCLASGVGVALLDLLGAVRPVSFLLFYFASFNWYNKSDKACYWIRII